MQTTSSAVQMVSAHKNCGEKLSQLLLKISKFAIKRNFFIAAKIATTSLTIFPLFPLLSAGAPSTTVYSWLLIAMAILGTAFQQIS